MDIDNIKNKLKRFAQERDWEQFHSHKNFAMAIAGEVGELSEINMVTMKVYFSF